MIDVISSTIQQPAQQRAAAGVGNPPAAVQPPAASGSGPSSIVSISAQAYGLYAAAQSPSPANTAGAAPTVTLFNPPNGATGVSRSANIVLTFSAAIKRGTGSILLRNGAGAVVDIFDAATSSRISIANNTLTIAPSKALDYNTQYTLSFASGNIKNLAGTSYVPSGNYNFKTLADTVPPTVTAFSPAAGAINVSRTANIALTFSEAIKRGSGAILLKNAAGAVVESFDAATSNRISIVNNTLTVVPTKTLDYNTQYTLSFANSSVKDLAGNAYVPSGNYSFKTLADTVPPTVTAFSPSAGAINVSRSANIALTFSEAIQRGTGTILLKNGAGAVVESFDAATSNRLAIVNNTLTIDPTSDLDYNTQYTLGFAPGTVKDLAGNNYAPSSTYGFKTVADTTPPTVTKFTPANGTTGVSTTANIVLTYSKPVQRGTGTILLKNAAGAVVESFNAATSNRINIANNTLTIDPTGDLANNTQYTLSFAAGSIKDLAGNNYVPSSTFSFKTLADTVPPTVASFMPANGATGVSPSANLVFTYSEAIKRGVGTILLKNAAGNVVESFDAATSNRINIVNNILTIDPTADLADNTQYSVSFAAGSIKDLAGNNYTPGSTYSFTTAVDTHPPTVTNFSPGIGAANVAPNANIALTFSEAIQRGSGTISIKDDQNNVIESFDAATSNRIAIVNNVLTIDPTNPLADNTHYTVSFAAGTVKDLAGNDFAGIGSYDFTTATDATPPTVTNFSPGIGAADATIGANIVLTFSEAIQRGSGSIVIRDDSNNIIESFDAATSNELTYAGNTLTINPANDLVNSTHYRVSLDTGSVKDLTGNAYVGSSSYNFTTAHSAFNIDVTYSGDPSYQTYFDQAKAVWEKVIVGDVPDMNGIDDVRITASVAAIDGPNGILAQAGPTQERPGTYIPLQGTMTFDSADLANMIANGTLVKVITHEMGHVLGFGTNWSELGLNSTPGHYTGTNALNMYKSMSGNNSATYVPLETGGGAGTANVHWSESVFHTELMTGYAEPNNNMPLSKLTIAAMADLGYQVNYSAADNYTLA